MKILHLMSAFQLGGAETIVETLSSALVTHGHEVALATALPTRQAFGQRMKEQLSQQGVSCYELGLSNKTLSLLVAPLRLHRLLKQFKPDIVHSHTDIPDWILASALRLQMKPAQFELIRTIHNTQLWPDRKFWAYYTEKMYQNDQVVFVSQAAGKAYFDLCRRLDLSPASRQRLIYNAVKAQQPDQKILQDQGVKLPKDKLTICFAGRFVHQKGFDILIKVFGQMPKMYRDQLHLFLFGQGEMQPLIDTLPSGDYWSLFPPINHISRVFSYFDYLVMPSRFEGLPMVAIEAMMAGTPLIASRSPGLNEAMPESWPLSFDKEDVEGLLQVIINILEQKYNRNELSQQGQAFVQSRFAADQMVEDYENLYHQMLSRSRLPEANKR